MRFLLRIQLLHIVCLTHLQGIEIQRCNTHAHDVDVIFEVEEGIATSTGRFNAEGVWGYRILENLDLINLI